MNTTTRRRFLQTGAAGAAALAVPIRFARAAKKGGVMRMGKGHGQTADSLDPATHENGFMLALVQGYNNYLTEVAGDGSLVGQLAESWDASADAATWTFKLRKGVTYHNGRDVTAGGCRRIHQPSPWRGVAIRGQADRLAGHGHQGRRQAHRGLHPRSRQRRLSVHRQRLPPAGDAERRRQADWQSGIGAGAYRIKSFEPGVRVDLDKYADYWNPDRGHFDAVQMISIIDPTARTNALITGEVDAIDRVDLKTAHLMKRKKGIKVHSIAGTQHYTFPMRTNVAPFSDNNVRLALKHAINREEMVEKILQGFGVVGNDHPIGPGQRFFAKDLEQRTYDPDKAKHYLKQAGMDSLAVDLSVADAAFAGAVDAGALFAESAKAAGINLNIVREPNDGYWSNVWNKKPFCACYWGGRPTADWMFSTAYEAGVPWNDAAWEHEKFNKQLKVARAELDESKRRAMYAEMQQIVRDEGGTIIPMFASYVFATSEKLSLSDQIASNWDLDGERWMERWSFA